MIILTLRTDKPGAELGLYNNEKKLGYIKWQAHRELSETIHVKIKEVLNKSSIPLRQVQGIVVYKGPGSFTGLRIGMSVANALAYSQNIPVAAKSAPDWINQGLKALTAGENDKIALPEYGQPAKTTKPRK